MALMRTGLLLALLVLSASAAAQVYKYVDENGVTNFTNIPPNSGKYKVHNLGCYGTCRKGVNWRATPLKVSEFQPEIRATSEVYGVDEALIRAIIHAESWFNPEAVSRTGAQGLMQLMPATQTRFGVADPFDPVESLTGGVAYLDWLLSEFKGDWELAVAAYNAGENAVRRHDGIPPFDETREYVRRVRILYSRYRSGG